jgi:hypothetical protein
MLEQLGQQDDVKTESGSGNAVALPTLVNLQAALLRAPCAQPDQRRRDVHAVYLMASQPR